MNKTAILKKIKYSLRFIPDKMFMQIYFVFRYGHFCNLKNPKTLSEKIQWLKLYDRMPQYTTMADKYAVKDYVADKIGIEHIIPTLGVWDSFDDIDFDKLPNQFVLKCTHDSAGHVIVKDKSKFDKDSARKKIESCLKCNYYYVGREWQYKNIKPRVLAEPYLEDSTDKELRDYKILCFGGEPKVLLIAANRSTGSPTLDFFDKDFNHLDVKQYYPHSSVPVRKPKTFDQMFEAARVLSKGMPHIRVDFYEVDGKMYFGELTLHSGNGFSPYEPKEWDELFGSWVDLSEKMKK